MNHDQLNIIFQFSQFMLKKNSLKASSFVVNIAQVGPIRNMENIWGSKRLTCCSLTILPSFTSLSANNNLWFCSLLEDIVKTKSSLSALPVYFSLSRQYVLHGLRNLLQVAGMLVYYILSDGKHPFGDMDREVKIKNWEYSLEHVQDIVAKDLVEWMINKEPGERLTVDEVLRHPFFWDDYR